MTHIPSRTYPRSIQKHPPLRDYTTACLDSAKQKLLDGTRLSAVLVELAYRLEIPVSEAAVRLGIVKGEN